MPGPQISERLRSLISNICNISPEKISLETHFIKDLKFDSLRSIELIMAIYEEFGIEISKDEGIKLQTVENLLNLLSTKMSQHEP
ncbi:MAG: hypothetical protein A2X86_08470 [Bdellovibrionales bacterium GWA2_49_15]|nr:MAG: hypothetical protein A2X86_08470 [Bdellovibrionales bacterium GWA2_49_15]